MPVFQRLAAQSVAIGVPPRWFISDNRAVTVQRALRKGQKEDDVPLALKKKFGAILSHEISVARSVAATVVRSKPLSVWEVLIPIIFILMFMKTREEREVFVQNLTFTKRMALEAALKMTRDQQSMDEVMAPVKEQTRELVDTAPNGIYSDRIRMEQLKEVRLLIDHYCRLLKAEGADFRSLLLSAYPTFTGYSRFLKQLREAESQVAAAARNTLGARADTDTLAKIETAVNNLRIKQAEEMYASG